MVHKIKASLVIWASWLLAGCTGLPGEGGKDTGGSDSAGRETDSGHADSGEAETGETGMAETGDSDRDSGETGDEDTDTSDTSDTSGTMDSGDSDELSGADAKLIGEEEGDYAGAAVAALGDVNGDGRADLLVAAPERETDTVYLILGPVAGRVALESADGRLTLESDGIEVPGWSVLSEVPIAGTGDNDGDDLPDLILGTQYAGTETTGIVWLLPGNWSGSIELTDATGTLYGVEDDSLAGTAVAGPGDVNGDGWDDVLVGAPNVAVAGAASEEGDCATEVGDETVFGGGTGAAYLVLGPVSGERSLSDAQARFTGEDASDGAGSSLAKGGDLDGDGFSDLFIGSLANCEGGEQAGAAYVIQGPVSGELALADADAKLIGEYGNDAAGEVLSGAGDVNGDGYPDLLVAAPSKDLRPGDLAGRVYVILSPISGDHRLSAADAFIDGNDYSLAGYSIAAAGDVAVDGYDDILVGAISDSSGIRQSGSAYLLTGPLSGDVDLTDVEPILSGAAYNDGVGCSVTGPGDVDADGLPDILVGAPGDDEGGTSAGAAWLFSGASL